MKKNKKNNTINNTCFSCGAKCCKDISVKLETPRTKKDWDEIKWLILHKNVSIYKDFDNDWLIEFKTPCEALDEKNFCKIYKKRPIICGKHSSNICIENNKDPYYKIIFKNINDVESFLKTKKYKWSK